MDQVSTRRGAWFGGDEMTKTGELSPMDFGTLLKSQKSTASVVVPGSIEHCLNLDGDEQPDATAGRNALRNGGLSGNRHH